MEMVHLTSDEYAEMVAEHKALEVKLAAQTAALKRAHDLVLHIDNVLPTQAFSLIDTASWNAVTADMRDAPKPAATEGSADSHATAAN